MLSHLECDERGSTRIVAPTSWHEHAACDWSQAMLTHCHQSREQRYTVRESQWAVMGVALQGFQTWMRGHGAVGAFKRHCGRDVQVAFKDVLACRHPHNTTCWHQCVQRVLVRCITL